MKKLAVPAFALILAAVIVTLPTFAAPAEATEEVVEREWILEGNMAYAEVWRLGHLLVVEGTVRLPNGTEFGGTFLFLWRDGKTHIIRLQDDEFKWSMDSCRLHLDRGKIDVSLTWSTRPPTNNVHKEISNDEWSLNIDGSARPARARGSIEPSEGRTRPLFGRGSVFQGKVHVTKKP